MNIGDRIGLLREVLGLSQEEFASRLGLTRGTISNYELGKREAKGPVLAVITTEFNVNREWLETGQGEMFAKDETISLDDYAARHHMSPLEKDILKAFLMIDPSIRQQALDWAKEIFTGNTSDEISIDAKVEAYRQELLQEKRAEGKSSLSEESEENLA